ncbi:MAG: HAMP domain-containing histidine kinase [Actinobacteria bacterium]|nr:HAMP domain-containing histidine kinase [Actinomycetota bacterium]
MTRRLVVLMVGLVCTTLLVAGIGTLVIAHARARSITEDSLREQAADVATGLGQALGTDTDVVTGAQERQRLRQLAVLGRVLDLDGIAVLTLDRAGRVLTSDELPPQLDVARLDLPALQRGEEVTGHIGDLVWAAAPVELPRQRTGVIVLSQEASPGLGQAARYFVLAAVASAIIGLLVAIVAGRRLTRPVRAASDATTRIAAGELSTRLPEPGFDRHDELAELSRSVNTMAAALERSRSLEQQFLLSVSHDLRTPLTSIRGYADALTDGTVDPARSAAIIRSEARRLERLVADLLDLAKLQSASFTLHAEPVDLGQLAVASGDGFQPDAADRGVSLHVQPWPGRLLVTADHDRLAQVLANLVENALKYASTAVHVATGADRDWAVLTVRDDGPGIEASDLPHVFERLYVARRQPARAESSSGLGLAIVHQLVTAMGGQVWVTSEVGLGTTFGVRLPLTS